MFALFSLEIASYLGMTKRENYDLLEYPVNPQNPFNPGYYLFSTLS